MRSLLGAGGEVITHPGQEDLWSRRLYGLPLLAGWHSLVITVRSKLLGRQQRRNQRGLEGICKATAACGLPLCIVKRYRFYSAKRWTSFSLAPYTGIGSLTRSCRRTPIGIKGTGPAPWRHCDSGLVSAVGRRP